MCIVVFLLLLSVFSCVGQEISYRNPLDGELILSGNFGEIRGNHFHSGLDLKTGGVEGKPVYAIEDGFVSRIAVSSGGFGKALYIEHSNGLTSVYAHLRNFNSEIADYVKAQQYANKSFDVDLTLEASQFRISKGQVIASSGNSGGSGGPHLHFEIRETLNQIPANPLNYGFKVKDTRNPELQKLWIYVHSKNSHVDGLTTEKGFSISGNRGVYHIETRDTIKASGSLSFGVAAFDRFSSSQNVCGIYSAEMKVNGKTIHQQQIDKFSFSQKRMVNCHIDYEKRKTEKHFVYRSYIAPENKLGVYSNVVNGGIIAIEIGKVYSVEINVSDYEGNISKLNFTIVGQKHLGASVATSEFLTGVFYPQKENSFSNSSLRMSIPEGCLYDTLRFKYDLKSPCAECIAPVHSIGNLTDTPLDKYMTLSFKLNEATEKNLSKAVVVSFDDKGNPLAEGGTTKWNWITTRTRSFGDYSVMLDTLSPELRPKNFKNQTSTSGIDTLRFHFEDDLAGIKSYSGILNGEWVLLEHDPKNDELYYIKDERFLDAQNTFRITSHDAVGNAKDLSVTVR